VSLLQNNNYLILIFFISFSFINIIFQIVKDKSAIVGYIPLGSATWLKNFIGDPS